MSEKDMDKIKEDLESNADREAAHYQSESETNEHTSSKASNESKSSRETEILMKMPP